MFKPGDRVRVIRCLCCDCANRPNAECCYAKKYVSRIYTVRELDKVGEHPARINVHNVGDWYFIPDELELLMEEVMSPVVSPLDYKRLMPS